MKKLLVIGAGILQIPAIKKAKEMGLFVGVVDMDMNAPGVKLADKFLHASTIDIETIIDLASNFKPDGVMTLATDMPMRSVAAVAEKLHLLSILPDVAEKATDKVKMIKCFAANKVPHPWFEVIASEQEFVNTISTKSVPYIIKPNDSSGSRGVFLVKNEDEALTAFRYSQTFSKSGTVLVEEYMNGPEVSVEIIVVKGQVSVLAITDKLTTGSPYFVEMGHSQPSQLPEDIVKEISNVAIKAVKAIGIDNSPAHVEIIVTESGPKLVELGARLGGDNITSSLVPLSTGIDMVQACIHLALGEDVDIMPILTKGAAIRYLKTNKGILKEIKGIKDVLNKKSIQQITFVKQIGDKVDNIKSSADRIGYVIAQADSAKDAIIECQSAINQLNIIVE